MKSLFYLNKYLLKYKTLLILGILFTIISNVFKIAPAPVVREAFDTIEQGINKYNRNIGTSQENVVYNEFLTNILYYGLVILGLALVHGVFLFMIRQTIIVMSRHIEYDLKNEIYEHYQRLDMAFYRRNNTGDLMARISEDVSQVRMYLGPAIMYSLNLTTLTVMAVVYMFTINAKLAFFTLLPLPVLSICVYFVSNLINKQSTAIQQSLSALSTFVQEAFSGIRVLKAFAKEKTSAKNFEKASEDYKEKSIKLAYIQAFFFPLIIALIGLSNVLVLYIGGLEVMAGNISNGVIAEFIIYVNMLTWPVISIGWVTSLIQRAAASQTRINEFLQTETPIASTQSLEADLKGDIAFENVNFIYPDTGIHALQAVSFNVKAGENLAILGTTGSGKSTIANLICRLYDVSKGQVLIDKVPIQNYDLTNLRRQIGYVPQDVFLFSDSISSNVAFGLEPGLVSDENIAQATRDADLYESIMDFKYQFDTRIGERGISLSGGQKQRLSIARAIIRSPKILILDDSLSAVDTKTENTILENLEKIMKNRTSIIISHRVSSAKLADKIIVLDNGKIIQEGTHEALIKEEGHYKELYEKQLQSEGI